MSDLETAFFGETDGVRESTQSWREVLLKLKSRGMNIPKLAIGDGAMGFWAALEEVYGETRQQRCWMHKTMNVLNCLPKSAQAKAKQALHAIWQAATKADAEKAFELFLKTLNRSIPRRPCAYRKTVRSCWRSMIFRHHIGKAFARAIRLNPTFARSGTGSRRSKGCLSRYCSISMNQRKLYAVCAEELATPIRGFDTWPR